MDKTIENKLFDEFRTNGAASMSLEYFKEKEDCKDTPTEYLLYNDTNKVLSRIKERTEAFCEIAWPMGLGDSFPLAEEIIANLNSCATDKQKENYIISILEVFKDWAAVFSPVAEINEMRKAIELSQNDDEFEMLGHYKKSLVYLGGLHDHYLEIMKNPKEGTVEYYLDLWHRCYHHFCRMLAAELAKNGVNLLEIQYKRGIWIVEKLDILSIQAYFGITNNYTYANNLLEELDAPNTKHLILTERNGKETTREEWEKSMNNESIEYFSSELPKRKGRPKTQIPKMMIDLLLGNEMERKRTLSLLHSAIDGKIGKEVAFVIYACYKANKLTSKPPYSTMKQEFGDIGNESGFNRYFKEADWRLNKDELKSRMDIFL